MTASQENSVLRSLRSPAKGSTRFQCTTCLETFRRADHLLRHGIMHRGKGKSFPCFECCRAFNERAELASHVRSVHPVPPSSRKKRLTTAFTPSQVSNSSRQGDSVAGAAIKRPAQGHPVTVAGQALADISEGINQQHAPARANCDGEHNSTQGPASSGWHRQ
ncbi:hypothetical protein H112_02644 [Trichophyton rubrum D6]|uniref:C2H2-type domain-containing protein n=2 Tax=Trichophyton TaxID=5550 RepID=A0A022W8L0_TRIRU|nr:hypothetical protein H100_02651 [Trichophyton rubrum MR850]EZF44020.1 hypothetical protein H102_02642 [Trichophyton rubrum CBS 100081]EZF54682.1 hypothetical protein H103_02655 [Trichophyton rubrum CBS 288.86]EZF65259.1 hypothetical protein H104_02633 [Trichophyton rubrum CBS 289.86]EZF75958.1 hypothetical protein H105_02661 [Trichophyton soudanense CBS 452.61]EZF86580.1 hypothetical protein H110_02650 [Trichophyton rubrum MR1448]EZF97344.1 hypothetical protein H113_02658 [Trichophyton rub